ncbi:MAG: hypothetical protein ACFE0J_16255, partial [Elainellaceae cyanobacterium]
RWLWVTSKGRNPGNGLMRVWVFTMTRCLVGYCLPGWFGMGDRVLGRSISPQWIAQNRNVSAKCFAPTSPQWIAQNRNVSAKCFAPTTDGMV